MSEDSKIVETVTQTEQKNVEMTQEKLDSLINQAYARGAKNAKDSSALDEATKTIETLNNTIKDLEGREAQIKAQAEISEMVYRNEVADADYFQHLLKDAKQSEDFSEEAFVEKLKAEKPYIFKGVKQQVQVDSSSNAQTPSFEAKVKSATSMDEIYALQKELS